MNDACKTGDISESIFATQALRRGWWVYTSNGHARPADAIVVRPPMRPISIQIKTATVYPDREDTYGVMVCRGKGPVKVSYLKGDFDILAAWLPDVEKFVFWRFDEIAERKKIYYSPRRHRQPDNWDLFETLVADIITPHATCPTCQ